MKKSFIIGALLFFGCHDHEIDYSKIKTPIGLVDPSQVEKAVDQFEKSHQSEKADALIDTLIRLNRDNGFLFFEKGYIEGEALHTIVAIRDFRIAEKLKYNKKRCEIMIRTAQILIDDGIK